MSGGDVGLCWWLAWLVAGIVGGWGSVLLVMESRLIEDARMLTPAAAAVVAGCSVRTIRRAYLGGTLVAYRDARGRGVRIRYGDLREWMMCEVVGDRVESGRLGVVNGRGSGRASSGGSDNLALLVAARERRAKRAVT